jgi:hypothetical protein
MPICIAGMHRSGTSLITRLLNLSGLDLGQAPDLQPANEHNPEGYWENRKFVAINDEVLTALGGGWDYAPTSGLETLPPETPRRLSEQARLLIREFEDREPWGWKDPRSSLLGPFWLSVIPDLRFVICLRNPLDVAASLYRRNQFSLPRSLELWKDYNARLLACTSPERRVITHYDAYFADAESELRRVVACLGLPMRAEAMQECAVATRTHLRHNRAYLHQLLGASVPREVFDLYMAMCEEAGWREGGGLSVSSGELQQQLAASVQAEIGTLRQDQAQFEALAAERDGLAAERDALRAALAGGEAELAWLQAELERRTRDYAAILCSTSWRITAPLRSWSLSAGLRRIARR